MTNELLLIIGISVSVLSIVFAFVYLIISKVQKVRLDARFDIEYGEEVRRKREKSQRRR